MTFIEVLCCVLDFVFWIAVFSMVYRIRQEQEQIKKRLDQLEKSRK